MRRIVDITTFICELINMSISSINRTILETFICGAKKRIMITP